MSVGGGRRGWGGNTTINSGRSCERGLDATRGLVSLGLDNIDCKVGGVSRVAWGSNGHSAVVPLEPSFNPSVVIWITNLSFVVCVSDGGCVEDTLGSGGAGGIGISAGGTLAFGGAGVCGRCDTGTLGSDGAVRCGIDTLMLSRCLSLGRVARG